MRGIESNLDERGVCRIVFNRSDNTYDDRLAEELSESFTWCAVDRRVRVVVVSSRGSNFASGPDDAWLGRVIDYDYASNLVDASGFARALYNLYNIGKPTIARVHGLALGFGVGIVAACDVAVADYDVKFQITDVRMGLVPSLVSPYLSKAVGSRSALRYLMSGEEFDSVDAQRIGLIQEVVPKNEIDKSVDKLIGGFLKAAPRAVTATKEIVRKLEGSGISGEVIEITAQKLSERRNSKEGLEGIAAYLSRSDPFWYGN